MQYGFDEQSIKRVIEQVRWAEGHPKGNRQVIEKWSPIANTYWQPCQNQNAVSAPAYSLVAVVGLTTLADDDRPFWLVDQAATTFHRLCAVTGPDPIASNDYGVCTFGPWVRFAFDTSPAIEDGFGAKPGTWAAAKHYPASISAAGVVDATNSIGFGQLAPVSLLIGKTTAGAINKGTSGTVNIYGGAAGAEIDTTQTVSAFNLFGNVAANKWVALNWVNGNWYLIAAEC